MATSDYFFNAHAQYYSEYLLSKILERAYYKLMSIEMVKESYFVEDDTYDFLVAKVSAASYKTGAISYPKIYPRFFTCDDFDDTFLGKCDDLIVRFSIFFNKTGFFSPLWTELYKNGQKYKSGGSRMDWDIYRNIAPKMSTNTYSFLNNKAANSTFQQNDEVVLRTIPIWLGYAAVYHTDE